MAKLIQASRREFILGTGGAIALSSLPNLGQANSRHVQQGVVLYKEHNKHSSDFAAVIADAGLTAIALGADPVRQWRDSIEAALADKNLPLLGLTNWSDYLIMRGLAAELRRHPVLELQHQVFDNNWASKHAADLLEMAQGQTIQALSGKGSDVSIMGKSLFSWVII